MKVRCFLPVFLFLFSFLPHAFSQISDDFSDGDFSQNPAWQGDVANFIVNAGGELQLNAPAAGASQLVVQGNIPDSAIWNLRFELGFAPSNQNLLRIYVLADQTDLTTANGYFLEIGETGSQDALRFFRQDAGAKSLLATGQPALVASNPDIQLRIKRTITGDWEISAAPVGSALQLQFSITDATYGGGTNRFVGFQCIYTTSNVGKFYFDDLSILPDVPDTQPPVLLAANADDATTVKAVFDENLDSLSAVNVANYSINNGVGQPVSATLLGDKRSLQLTLSTPLATGNYTLQTSGVKDILGNESLTQTADFQFVKIEPAAEFDILITEIMADPSPAAGLPEVEWLELLNRSQKIIDLATLRVQDATGSPVILPTSLLMPGEYVVITATANAAILQTATNGAVLGAPIGVTALNNDSDVLTISDLNGNVIDRVAYSVEWHTDANKDDGGWSLERINPDLPCLGRVNWQSCPTPPGGTPGAQNASFQNVPDNEAPRLFAAFPESPTSVLLTFSEGLDKNVAQNPAAYTFSPPRNVALAEQVPDERAQVRITLLEPLQVSVLYAITAKATVTDCSGNAVPGTDTVFVGLTEKPDFQDIVINEVMFNPASGNGRYIEFYNRSQKIFNWSEFFIADFSDGADVEKINLNRLFLPGAYHVFTENPNNIRSTFANIHPENVLENNLPSLTDDEGNVTLYWSKDGETVVLDSLDYTEDWHNALFTGSEREGVALERISPDDLTNLASNWTSASPVVTGAPGTPTLPNSQNLPAPDGSDLIQLLRERLSPDDDGFEDFLPIAYTLPGTGFFASMTIFDAEGLPVKRLVRQELIGSEGSLRWDGDLDDGSRAKPGIYVLFLELFAPSGDTERVKKAVAVVGRF